MKLLFILALSLPLMGQSVATWADSIGKATLGFCIKNYPPNMNKDNVDLQIQAALFEWSKYVEITFTPTSCSSPRTIAFSWLKGDHGDGWPFYNIILAHTHFPFPAVPEPLAGDVHFNLDRDWDYPLYIYQIALHEIGHSLGLQEARDWHEVMYMPLYLFLQAGDISAIRKLYKPKCYLIECAMRNTP